MAAQGSGVARALVRAAERRLRDAGLRMVQIEYEYVAGDAFSERLYDWYEGSCGFVGMGGPPPRGEIGERQFRRCRKRLDVDDDKEEEDAVVSAVARLASIPASTWLAALSSVLCISVAGLLTVAVLPLLAGPHQNTALQLLVALAVGTLVGDALMHLLPHALNTGQPGLYLVTQSLLYFFRCWGCLYHFLYILVTPCLSWRCTSILIVTQSTATLTRCGRGSRRV